MSIFNFYPYINYNNQKARYIVGKAEIIKQYLSNYGSFYAYTILDGERPDTVAFDQYGDSSLDWVILTVNSVTDPYFDWPLSSENFNYFLEDKYGTAAYKLSSVKIPSSIAYYYYKGLDTDTPEVINSYNYTMSLLTYETLGMPAGWVAKSIYDVESEINESKRDIKLLRPQYLGDFQQQLKDLFING
jgi:hypothetical protein